MLKLALKLFPRMLRDRAFALLLGALIIACGTITAISLFIERIDNTLSSEAASFIAADAKIDGSLPMKDSWLTLADEYQLETAHFVSFRAMTFSDTTMTLTQIKAVDDAYPLKGELQTGKPLSEENQSDEINTIQHGPQPGHAWLAPRLFAALNIEIGDTIKIGNAEFVAQTAILKEPDSAQSMFGVEPRVMIHLDDVAATDAVQVGSRINYAFLVSGPASAIQLLKTTVEPELGEHHRWLNPEDGSMALDSAMDRARQFLLLSGSLSVILAGVAIALAAHRFALTQQTQVALLKSLGVQPAHIRRLYLALLTALGALGFVLGSVTGWILHHGILVLLGNLIPQDLAIAGGSSFAFGLLTTLIMLFSFAAPPLLALRNVSPSQILRNEKDKLHSSLLSACIGVAATAGLIWLYSQSLNITVILLLGLSACIVISVLLSRVLYFCISRLQMRLHSYWRLGMANLQRQRAFTTLQIFIFSCVALLLNVLFQVRTDLLQNWQPLIDDTPNHFVFNIFEDELQQVQQYLEDENIRTTEFYPMSRGRFTRINDAPVEERIVPGESRTSYERELNLTWSRTLGEDNEIIAGRWFDEENELLVSAEEEYAAGLGLVVGETLHFSIAGREFHAKLHSIRSVKWDSMNPNFFMIFNQPIANNFASNWLTSFYLPKDRKHLLNALSRKFPTVSIVELDQTLDVVRDIVERVSMAIEFILILVGLASILVLLTSVYATLDERIRESALLRSFGAPRRFVQGVLLVEFATIGLVAGLFAAAVSELCLFYIQVEIFQSDYAPGIAMWFATPLLSAGLIAAIGYSATVSTTHVAPAQALRQ